MKDPRREPRFKPALFPACDGQPVARRGRNGGLPKEKLHFLAAYYRINVAYAALVARRNSQRGRTAPAGERRLLQRIERAIVAKERLEDRHASRGIVASPVYHEGYAVDVRFQLPGQPRSLPTLIVSSACRRLTFAPPRRKAPRPKA